MSIEQFVNSDVNVLYGTLIRKFAGLKYFCQHVKLTTSYCFQIRYFHTTVHFALRGGGGSLLVFDFSSADKLKHSSHSFGRFCVWKVEGIIYLTLWILMSENLTTFKLRRTFERVICCEIISPSLLLPNYLTERP